MGALDYKTRRHRRNRLAAALAATYHPRRHFRLGQDVGWHWQFDNPNDLYRRRNRLTYTRDFSNAAWLKQRCSAAAAPSGGFTTITEDASAASSHYWYRTAESAPVGTYGVYTLRVKKSATRNFALWVGSNASNPTDGFRRYVNLSTGGTTVPVVDGAGVVEVSTTVTEYDATTWLITCVMQIGTGGTAFGILNAMVNGASLDNVFYTGDGTSSVQAGYAQLETYTTTPTEYQDVPTTWAQAYLDAVGAERIYAWKDTAGTDPVTAVGDGIGLLLGREYGGATGPSLLANGATGLTGTATAASYSTTTFAGSVSRAGDASNQSWVTWTGLTTSAVHRIRITNTGATSLDVRNGGVAGTIVASIAAGASTWVHPATTGGSTSITITATTNSTTATFTLGQFAVLPGTHLTQATGTAKPTLSARVNLLLNSATLSTQNVTTLATGYRLRFEGAGTVTLSGTVTAGPLSAGTHNVTATAGTLTLTVSGSVTLADLRTADDAAKNIPAYQRVGATASDHDTDGFPHGVYPDGTDDSGTTATGGGNTTGFFYCGALTVSGGAGAARTIWSDTGTNTGYRVRINASNKLELAAGNGSAYTTVQSNETITAPGTYLLSAWDDGGVLAVQVNNLAPATTTRPAVSAGTAAITVYKDNGAASSYFNGRDYGSVYRQQYPGETAHNRLKRYLANVARITA